MCVYEGKGRHSRTPTPPHHLQCPLSLHVPFLFPPGNVSTRNTRVKISSVTIRQARLFDCLNQSSSQNRQQHTSTIPRYLGTPIILNEYTRLTSPFPLPIIPTNRALAWPPKPWPERQVLRHPLVPFPWSKPEISKFPVDP